MSSRVVKKCVESRCAPCSERLKDSHTHPEQWKSELQQLLLHYSSIPMTACVCRADERSSSMGGFNPRWVKRKVHKSNPVCCVPGCSITSERVCAFASFVLLLNLSIVCLLLPLPLVQFPSVHSITTLYTNTAILKKFFSAHCVVLNVGTVLVVHNVGPLDQYHNHRLLRFC